VRRDLGDFQTPRALATAVIEALGPIGERWSRVLEPTCGRGEFLAALLDGSSPPREICGIEIQDNYCAAARRVARGTTSTRITIKRANLFDVDLRRDVAWRESGPLLVVGNPPWVTNAALGVLGSGNHPRKVNVKSLRGIDARTGSSNFDIAEAVWLKLIAELAGENATIALLCKTSVARGVLQFASRAGLPIEDASLFRIDARRWFGAAVDACLFRVSLGTQGLPVQVPVFPTLDAARPETRIGLERGRLVADLDAYRLRAFADGRCPLTWRQGLKHDAAAVMELTRDCADGAMQNKRGEPVDVEPEWVYPLLKGSDLLGPCALWARRAVIVTQHRLGQDTRQLEHFAPWLWAYLNANGLAFARRKSSIYRTQPPFAMFGLGPYSFAPYKVAVSGLAKEPRFHAVGPVGGRPVMFDDTCYFVPCRSPEQAAIVCALLNDRETAALIGSLVFRDSKRPITKGVLERIDLLALSTRANPMELLDRAGLELERLESSCRAEPPRATGRLRTQACSSAAAPGISDDCG
jgi:hypothetical protein